MLSPHLPWRYLKTAIRRSDRLLLCSLITYLLGVIAAASVAHFGDPKAMVQLTGSIDQKWDLTTTALLWNNLVGIGLLLAGVVTFGASTLTNLLGSGFVHGYTLMIASVSPLEFTLLFVTHGLLELPGIWLAGAAGLRIPYEFTRYLRGNKETFLNSTDVQDVIVLSVTSTIMIIVAAVIEVQVTFRLAKVMLST